VAQPLIETEALAVQGEHAVRLARLIRSQFGFVWRLLRRVGMTETEAESALQQVFRAMAQRIGDLRQGSERAFLFGTVLHVASGVRRQRSEQVALSDAAPVLEDLDDQQQAREILGVLLEQMPLELRVVFVLHEVEQLPGSEIAEIVGIPLATVASRLSDALDDFATHLETGSDLSDSLMIAAREEQPPAGAMQHALLAVGLSAVNADMADFETGAVSAPGVSSRPMPMRAASEPAAVLAFKWFALGLIIGLALASTWAILEGQITIVLESRSHEKTGATGACELEARVSRLTFNESGLCADPSRMPGMPQILARNRPTRV
jgi:RNA polymerase sigma-70 factor (ECF subfamily)